jgi:molybdate transport system regulatory protein
VKISARNQLAGTVRSIDVGAVNTTVTIELAGGQQVGSVITKESAANHGLAVGTTAYAIIKASDVMVGVD